MTQPPVNSTELAELLIRAAARKNFPVVGEVLARLNPEDVDLAIYIRGPRAHLHILGAQRGLYLPGDPQALADPPSLTQIAQILEEVSR